MDKVRKKIIERMKAQKNSNRIANSTTICNQVQAYIKPGMTVGFYMAMAEEVQLHQVLKKCVEIANCAVPKIIKNGTMSFYRIDEDTTMIQNKWGIEEPMHTQLIPPNMFDVILVPMVGFDVKKHRIGHGAGYYDRYLSTCNALKIGVAFELQKCSEISVLPHDIDMDIIVTEATVYR